MAPEHLFEGLQLAYLRTSWSPAPAPTHTTHCFLQGLCRYCWRWSISKREKTWGSVGPRGRTPIGTDPFNSIECGHNHDNSIGIECCNHQRARRWRPLGGGDWRPRQRSDYTHTQYQHTGAGRGITAHPVLGRDDRNKTELTISASVYRNEKWIVHYRPQLKINVQCKYGVIRYTTI